MQFASAEPSTTADARQRAGPPPAPELACTRRSRRHDLGPRAARALETLGLHTVGDLLEHLPRDAARRARSPSSQRGETATVVVEVRTIDTRPVRRRGMRPLVEATVADATGTMKVAFFNQPWLAQRYPPGHAAAAAPAHDPEAATASGHRARADRRCRLGRRGAGRRSTRRREGIDSTRDPRAGARASRRDRRHASSRCRRGCARRSGCPTAPPRSTRAALPATSEDAAGGRRRLAFDELLLAAARAAAPPRSTRAAAARRRRSMPDGTLTARWLAERLPFPLDRRPGARDRRRSTPTSPQTARCSGC